MPENPSLSAGVPGEAPARMADTPSLDKIGARLEGLDALIFDMDHTLAKYKVRPIYALIYSSITEYLVEERDFPRELLGVPFDHAFAAKGVIFDTTTGDMLKFSDKGKVVQACHGRKSWLSKHEIEHKYGGGAWAHFELLRSLKKGPFIAFHTYFDVPSVCILAAMVDIRDAKGGNYDFMGDFFDALEHTFNYTAFAKQRGGFFPAITARPQDFLYRRDAVKGWLEALRLRGKRLLLVTNSHVDFSELVMQTAFGKGWRALFDG
eukprot:CAMPEP_0206217646 /NCGR_PEP_ID=MMETSP0047_2-20121206/3384_1 /ASSEMBLY_ACC=CAM_ASM_000192 /TAXON_ID=195065 /ORGANISM="Chroomonas mesostigmatica_cf, Strain CCMP1168" /LENGTH=263 /DNA_ID=CAMNT_0053640111 /DNA_START=31 /DNA_END=818 /DNA_ORIENTATION=+